MSALLQSKLKGSDKGPAMLEISAFKSLYGGHITLAALLLKPSMCDYTASMKLLMVPRGTLWSQNVLMLVGEEVTFQ